MCSIWRNSTQERTLIIILLSLNTLFVNLCSSTARQFCHLHLYQVFLTWLKFSPFCALSLTYKWRCFDLCLFPPLMNSGTLTDLFLDLCPLSHPTCEPRWRRQWTQRWTRTWSLCLGGSGPSLPSASSSVSGMPWSPPFVVWMSLMSIW